jgi:acyl-coenzyme A synthetase/AMP-(fatty) acid ligase
MLEDSRARSLIVSEELYPKFAKTIAANRELAHVIVSGEKTHGHEQFETLLAGVSGDPVTASTVRDDMCFWLYTSGSTGKPKAAVHTHADLKFTDELYGKPYLGITENDVCYSVAKLFFAYGLGNALTFPMSAGATTVLLAQRPTPDLVANILTRHGVTVFYGVPTFYAGFLADAAAPPCEHVRLRRCVSAGEALPPDVGRRFTERYGVDLLDGIGSTEMLHIFVSNRAGEVKYGTTGKPVPGYDVRLVDDDGEVIQTRGSTATSSIAAAATTCSRSEAFMSRPSRWKACCRAIPTCSKPRSWAGPTLTRSSSRKPLWCSNRRKKPATS